MLFAHDTEVALAAAAALVNTARRRRGATARPGGARGVPRHWQFTGSRVGDAAELAEVHELRAELAGIWGADEDGVVAVVNRLLRDGHALPQLVRHDGWGYHVHATEPGASVADRMGVEAAMALADVVRAGALDRLGRCAADRCDDVLVDLTRNAVPPVLRRQLRQPVARGRLPGAPDRRLRGPAHPVRSATSSSRTSRCAGSRRGQAVHRPSCGTRQSRQHDARRTKRTPPTST